MVFVNNATSLPTAKHTNTQTRDTNKPTEQSDPVHPASHWHMWLNSNVVVLKFPVRKHEPCTQGTEHNGTSQSGPDHSSTQSHVGTDDPTADVQFPNRHPRQTAEIKTILKTVKIGATK